jgi:phytoene synthase
VLMWCHHNRRTDQRVRNALADQHQIAREAYRYAAAGVALLEPRSRPCVEVALTLYSAILDRIEDSDFAVFSQRATVGNGRRLRVAGAGLLRSWRARLTQAVASRERRLDGG